MENKTSFKEEISELLTADDLISRKDELVCMIDEKRYSDFAKIISESHSADVAELIDATPEAYRPIFFRLLPKEIAADVFVCMDADAKEHIISSFTDKELALILQELYIDDTVDIIEEMPASVVKRIIRNSTHENRSEINRLLRYPKNSAGSIMTTEYVRFKGCMTVGEALDHIRRVAIDKETIYTCYVTDAYRRLLGIVTAKDLLISSLDTELSEIMEESVVSVTTTDDREEVANKFHKYNFLALPVVDNEHRLVGIVTVDDAIDVIREEAEEDFAKMAAITPTETPYLKESPLDIFKARIPWLLILMVSATLSSTILSFFEAAIAAVFVLFVPMLMDTGGNSGSQASVTVIRGISVGEVRRGDVLRVVLKELAVSALCGLSLALVAFGKVMLVDRLIMNNPEVTLMVAFIVSLTLAITVILAKLIGASLPILASRLGLDPAVMASPFITTVVDALSLIIYFLIASRLLPL